MFTAAVIRHMLRDPETPKTVRRWMRAEVVRGQPLEARDPVPRARIRRAHQ